MSIDLYPARVTSSPSAMLGYASRATDQGSILTVEVDLAALSVTVYVPPGRTIKVSGKAGFWSTVAGDLGFLLLKEGTTKLDAGVVYLPVAGYGDFAQVEAILTPTPGIHTYKLAGQRISGTGTLTQYANAGEVSHIKVEDITGGTGGVGPLILGHTQITADTGSIGATAVDIATLSVTVPANRTLRIKGSGHVISSVAQDEVDLILQQDGVGIQERVTNIVVPARYESLDVERIISPSAGTHTYKLQCRRSQGTGIVTFAGQPGWPSFLSVEDITGTAPPTMGPNSAVMLGYARVSANQNGIGTLTDLTGLSVTVTVPAGRQLRITGFAQVEVVTTAGAVFGQILRGTSEIGRWVYSDAEPTGHHTYTGSTIESPPPGTHTYKLTLSKWNGGNTVNLVASSGLPAYILVEDITGLPLPVAPASIPVGALAYAEVTANQGSIAGTELDLTGLTANFVVPAGRQIRITGYANFFSTVDSDLALMRLYMDGAVVQLGSIKTNTNTGSQHQIIIIESPSAGAHTLKLTAQRFAGTGTLTMEANSGRPAFILVEDVTPTPVPATTAPSSTLGYAEATAINQGSITSEVDVTGTSVTVTVAEGRRLKVTGFVIAESTVVGDEVTVTINRNPGGRRKYVQTQMPTANRGYTIRPIVIDTPAAGTYTYKLTIVRTIGTGTVTIANTSDRNAFLLVEDITAAAVNQPVVPGALIVNSSSRPAGQLEGTQIYETDTDLMKFWNGSNWVTDTNFRWHASGSALVGSPPDANTGSIAFKMQAGTAVNSTNVNGYAAYTFPVAFPNGLLAVHVTNGDGDAAVWYFPVTDQSLTGFEVRAFDLAGNVMASSGLFRINWLAIGW